MRQIEIDFSMGDKLGMLDAVFFDGRSGCSTKAALNAIASFGKECFASEETIARTANMGKRTFQRALVKLLDYSLVTCELKRNVFGKVTNHYRIVWTELQLRIDRQSSTQKNSFPVVPPVPTDAPLVQTDAPFVQTDAPFSTDRCANMAPKPPTTINNHHQPENNSAAGDVLELLENEFRSIGLHRFSSLAREFQGRVGTVLEAIAVYSRQRHKFKGPGAVVDFLRTNSWPADGVLSREELAPLDELRTATKATNEREKIRSDVARYWKSIGKWEFTDAEMNAEIDRRIERKTSMKGVA